VTQEELAPLSDPHSINPSPIPYGYCHCGCGEQTTLSDRDKPSRGIKKGEPNHWLKAHHRKKQEYSVEDRGYITPCWVWLQSTNGIGYGRINLSKSKHWKKHRYAHRLYYEAANGPIPAGMTLDHLCRVTLCVNPAHLEVVTQAVNVRRGKAAHLIPDQVRHIRSRAAQGERFIDIARDFNVGADQIGRIVSRQSWRDI
jgi:hypothetical protein